MSVLQVSCERSFSILKFLKNVLRNSLTQDYLEYFMLMTLRKLILSNLDNEDIINIVATRSTTFQIPNATFVIFIFINQIKNDNQ